ncbi:hypothetical protein J2T56_002527 [Natronobacillus azotifigens]|uniref:Uncharacterized protein n=1 Tax=Natronobacillus azotifigens TaxID=472978 RepID=A0A9J6RFW6_9BACI|nr:hypothetical protein [Natronobacillus azotifigens]MCZ0704227.1 hypothetical protein [Natronobacillus azotifigens]
MKKYFVTVCCMFLLSSFFATGGSLVLANDTSLNEFIIIEKKLESINREIKNELNDFALENEIPVSFEDANYEINTQKIQTEAQLDQEVNNLVNMIKDDLKEVNIKGDVEEKKGFLSTNSVKKGDGYWTARVEAIVPALRTGYIQQDFESNVGYGYVNSVNLLGDSYFSSGFGLSHWTPIRSWYNISRNNRYVQIHMKGTINYVVESSYLNLTGTWLSTMKADGGSFIRASYTDWPD